ncbi:UPF0183 protein C16orf70 homolog [Galendromus occidentalis]|uniref:UPF0183 protein C16orf70 homolog n=1 Tax=Galendromus occidentalis TaxID=34638 RepID=A0AAJ7L5A8_9ACAR|nr:UPF0183 protein C16orf70 homolog [Galendromus occidentalis]
MLEFQVVPEKSLINDDIQLVLGMSINQVIQNLQRQFEIIHSIELSYSDKHPLAGDIVLNLRQDGIRLVFEPTTQRLKLIEVTNLSKVKLTYSGTVFCSKDVPPTRDQIDETFGATYPGEFDADARMFHQKFRGLCFSFAADRKAKDSNSLHSSVVSRMSIYTGTSHKDTVPPPLPLSTFGDSIFLEQLKVIRDEGQGPRNPGRTRGVQVEIVLKASYDRTNMAAKKTLKRTILFGDSVSDVVSLLGSPSKIFYKEEDKMRIHSPSATEDETGQDLRSDYFYNYFTLGLDILFDARRHTAKKIVLHTNFPGHYDFNIYHRCNFTMVLPSLEQGEPKVVINTFSKWDGISTRLVPPEEKPVLLNRGCSTNTTNPFGSTSCYGCCGDVIIEVIGNNNHIASVTLFDSSLPS